MRLLWLWPLVIGFWEKFCFCLRVKAEYENKIRNKVIVCHIVRYDVVTAKYKVAVMRNKAALARYCIVTWWEMSLYEIYNHILIYKEILRETKSQIPFYLDGPSLFTSGRTSIYTTNAMGSYYKALWCFIPVFSIVHIWSDYSRRC